MGDHEVRATARVAPDMERPSSRKIISVFSVFFHSDSDTFGCGRFGKKARFWYLAEPGFGGGG